MEPENIHMPIQQQDFVLKNVLKLTLLIILQLHVLNTVHKVLSLTIQPGDVYSCVQLILFLMPEYQHGSVFINVIQDFSGIS